jgi:hypothetical protein
VYGTQSPKVASAGKMPMWQGSSKSFRARKLRTNVNQIAQLSLSLSYRVATIRLGKRVYDMTKIDGKCNSLPLEKCGLGLHLPEVPRFSKEGR